MTAKAPGEPRQLDPGHYMRITEPRRGGWYGYAVFRGDARLGRKLFSTRCKAADVEGVEAHAREELRCYIEREAGRAPVGNDDPTVNTSIAAGDVGRGKARQAGNLAASEIEAITDGIKDAIDRLGQIKDTEQRREACADITSYIELHYKP